MNKPTITMHVGGQFVCDMYPRYQCGFEGLTRFSYQADVTVHDLDEKGFVCDAAAIDGRIHERWGNALWFASCEMLASGLVMICYELAGPRARRIFTRVGPGPIPNRWITCEWKRGLALPGRVPERIENGV